jgi:hypothetical protein
VNAQKLDPWHDLILMVSASATLFALFTDAATTVNVGKVYVLVRDTFTLRVLGAEGIVQRALSQSQAAAVTVTVMVSTFAATVL